MNKAEFVESVVRFRKEANENKTVYELLFFISQWILVDDSGSIEIAIDKDDPEDIGLIKACQLAESFTSRDIKAGKVGWWNER